MGTAGTEWAQGSQRAFTIAGLVFYSRLSSADMLAVVVFAVAQDISVSSVDRYPPSQKHMSEVHHL